MGQHQTLFYFPRDLLCLLFYVICLSSLAEFTALHVNNLNPDKRKKTKFHFYRNKSSRTMLYLFRCSQLYINILINRNPDSYISCLVILLSTFLVFIACLLPP